MLLASLKQPAVCLLALRKVALCVSTAAHSRLCLHIAWADCLGLFLQLLENTPLQQVTYFMPCPPAALLLRAGPSIPAEREGSRHDDP